MASAAGGLHFSFTTLPSASLTTSSSLMTSLAAGEVWLYPASLLFILQFWTVAARHVRISQLDFAADFSQAKISFGRILLTLRARIKKICLQTNV